MSRIKRTVIVSFPVKIEADNIKLFTEALNELKGDVAEMEFLRTNGFKQIQKKRCAKKKIIIDQFEELK